VRFQLPDQLEKARMHFDDKRLEGYNSRRGEPNGAFRIEGPLGVPLRIISSGVDFEFLWEHVSVSTDMRCPVWEEMCFVKDLFWPEDEAVMQIHPPSHDYVNHHPYCLHLWRPMRVKIPLPPSILVGPI
jgi:hypothetical protein